MKRILSLAVAALTALTFLAPAANASQFTGWGWGQLKFADLPAWQSSAVVETLVTAQVQGRFEARRAALQPLVEQKVITGDQADLIATSTSNAIIAGLVKTGQINKAQAAIVRKALAGSGGWPAKQAAVRIALQSLKDAGLLTNEQADLVRAQVLGG